MSRDMSSEGSPTDVNTITMETIPACGMPAAPVLAAVTMKLNKKYTEWVMYCTILTKKRKSEILKKLT